MMNLKIGDAEGHHHIRHRVGLREHIADLVAGVDIPLGDVVLFQQIFIRFREPLPLRTCSMMRKACWDSTPLSMR